MEEIFADFTRKDPLVAELRKSVDPLLARHGANNWVGFLHIIDDDAAKHMINVWDCIENARDHDMGV
jgi:hypothetical protein